MNGRFREAITEWKAKDRGKRLCESPGVLFVNPPPNGEVTAALKRAVEVQPAAEGRSFQVVIDGERTWQPQRLMEAQFGGASRGSRA